MAKKVYKEFHIEWPGKYQPGDWIGVASSWPDQIEYPFEIRLRYSDQGELQCAGLRIGEGAGEWPMRFPWPVDTAFMAGWSGQKPKSNVTSTMLRSLPLGAVLRYIQDEGVHDPAVREYMERLALDVALVMPVEARSVVPGAPRKDEFYIEQAKLFAEIYAQRRRTPKRGSADVYKRLAERTGWAEVTVRGQVRRGWELRKDLKPDGVRERRTKQKPTQKPKPKETP